MYRWGLLLGMVWCSLAFGFSDAHTKGDYCKRALSEAPPKTFRIVTFNTKDLHINIENNKISNSRNRVDKFHRYPKTLDQVERLADVIKSTDPDIAVLQEVDSANELHFLNSNYFNNRYDVYFMDGNDTRGFEIAFLVRRGMPINIEIETHKHMRWVDPNTNHELPMFSRDAPAFIVRKNGEERPLFVLMGHHAKSKAGNKDDFEGIRMRTAQHEALAGLVTKYQNKFGADVPIMIAGDYNTDIHDAPETQSIRQVMTDAFDMAQKKLRDDDRVTHTTFAQDRRGKYAQLDGIMISKGSRIKVLRSGVRRDVSKLARSFKERDKQISDHFLVYADIEL